MHYLCNGVCSSDYCTEMSHEDEEVLILRQNLHLQTPNSVVEMNNRRFLISLVCIFFISVLISVVVANNALVIPGRHDVQVIVNRLTLSLFHDFIL